jgi:hypothetical protein
MDDTPPTARTDTETDDDHTHGDTRQSETREARISRDGNGDPIGAAVFLTADDIAALGVDPHTADAVTVSVADGEVRLNDTPDRATETPEERR